LTTKDFVVVVVVVVILLLVFLVLFGGDTLQKSLKLCHFKLHQG